MTALARAITIASVSEFGQREFLRRLSDPYWFQALGCALAFDWHSSGLTTTVTGALKEAVRGIEGDLGIFIAGGKGATSRKTPQHIEMYADRYSINPYPLIYASRMSAKVDSAAVQDGYQLYHHVLLFTHKGEWAVIQQGMNKDRRTARRYHWLGEDVRDFVVEPHRAVCCDRRRPTLNMVDPDSEGAREVSTLLSRERPEKVIAEINRIKTIELTGRHNITVYDIAPERLYRVLTRTYERQPEDFERLLSIEGVGPKTIRALSLVSELIYGRPPSYKDPAMFSFAHGGKDGTPFPVDRKTYDKTIEVMERAVRSAKLGNHDKVEALRRLAVFYGP